MQTPQLQTLSFAGASGAVQQQAGSTTSSEQMALAIQTQKNNLIEVKDLLARPDFESLKRNDTWEKGIRYQRRYITNNFGGQNVTKAWLKMYEILTHTSVGNLLTQAQGTVNCFFNAELPGGFIYAVNHFLRTYNKQFDWVIASYLPKNTQGKDFLKDDFSLLSKYPGHSLVGPVITNRGSFWCDGDLTNPKMPAILAALATSRLSPIHLYTADGGFGVEGRENLQEELTLPLIRGEVECGLRSLTLGGVMIIKIFTFFTPQMWTMLVYLMRAFEQYDIFKPQTSGALNSESYFIGIGYRGLAADALTIIARDSADETTRYAIPTETENAYLLNKMTSMTNRQINNIRGFLVGKGPKLTVELKVRFLRSDNQL